MSASHGPAKFACKIPRNLLTCDHLTCSSRDSLDAVTAALLDAPEHFSLFVMVGGSLGVNCWPVGRCAQPVLLLLTPCFPLSVCNSALGHERPGS